VKIGVLAPADIALRRFMPALAEIHELDFAGVAVHSSDERFGSEVPAPAIVAATMENEANRAQQFIAEYGGDIYPSYEAMVSAPDIDAIYIPLPPGLHAYWGKEVLLAGKHLFMEKPFTTSASETRELLALAQARKLAVQENYMFAYHAQLEAINKIIASGAIGDPRLIRIDFGFPRRSQNDFRYDKTLGGGALLDAGGYPLRYATMLLGPSAKVMSASSSYGTGTDVDLYGAAMLTNDQGACAQIAFGMDNSYRCDLNVWGSTGTLTSSRILTAPEGFVPSATITNAGGSESVELPADDAFRKSIEAFLEFVANPADRMRRYEEIQHQADLVESFRSQSGVAI